MAGEPPLLRVKNAVIEPLPLAVRSWLVRIVALVALPLMAVVFGIIGPKSQKAFNTQWRKVGRLNARVEESFSGHALVRVYGREKDSREKFQEENEDLYQAAFKAQFLSGLMMPAMMFIGSLSYVGIAVLGGLMVASGQLRLGDVQAFIQYSQQFSQPLGQLGGMATAVQSGTASAERIFELLDAEEQEPETTEATAAAGIREGRVEFEHVRFSYSPDRELIRDLSLVADPGHTVAIVGPTGAGKTTLVNLVMRFYEVGGGRITVDGIDTRTGTIAAGLFFIAYQKNAHEQFVRIQNNLAQDGLNEYIAPISSSLFAVPPGLSKIGDWYGKTLFGYTD